MNLICAWCGVTIQRSGYNQPPEPNTSHGMCPACSEALAAQQQGVSLQRHIDSIPTPILLVDRNNKVVAMNANACRLLGTQLEATAEQPFGEVFDCVHSSRPEGCGRTVHCSGCAIRRSVVATFDTGAPQILVPATLSVENPDQLSDAILTITTVKTDGVVLLRIDEERRVSS